MARRGTLVVLSALPASEALGFHGDAEAVRIVHFGVSHAMSLPIQRLVKGDAGFGAGNFRALFDGVEGQKLAKAG